MSKTVLFRTIKFIISAPFSSISPISGATTPGQSGTGIDGSEGVQRVSQSSSITEVSPSDCLVSYAGYSLWRVLPLCKDTVGVFCSPCRLGHRTLFRRVLPLCRVTVGVFCSPNRQSPTIKYLLHSVFQ